MKYNTLQQFCSLPYLALWFS